MLLWIFVYKVFCVHIFWLLLRNGIAGSYSNSSFNILRNCPTVFKVTVLFYITINNLERFSFFSHSCQDLLLSFLLIIDFPMDENWYIILLFVCISLMTDDVDHLFMHSLAILIKFFVWWNVYSKLVFTFKLI